MMKILIDTDIIIKSCKIVDHPKGDIVKIINKDDSHFSGFGEAYTTSIKYNEIKGWKMHKSMKSTLYVLRGAVEFSFFNRRKQPINRIILHENRPVTLNIINPIWFAFRGYSDEKNTILNIANIKHNPSESINLPLSKLLFDLPELVK